MNIPRLNLPRVAIVGGGFAGLYASKKAERIQGSRGILEDQKIPSLVVSQSL